MWSPGEGLFGPRGEALLCLDREGLPCMWVNRWAPWKDVECGRSSVYRLSVKGCLPSAIYSCQLYSLNWMM